MLPADICLIQIQLGTALPGKKLGREEGVQETHAGALGGAGLAVFFVQQSVRLHEGNSGSYQAVSGARTDQQVEDGTDAGGGKP